MSNDASFTPYERWVRRLYQTNLFNPVKLGLQNIQQLHSALGSPIDRPNLPVVHIAGTNGKGSVALKIANTLQLSNPALRVGLFCSPHVSSFRERMQINGKLIPEDEVVKLLPKVYEICRREDIPATFFEVTTALAFLHFQGADVVVLETGLGGRLDATNVLKSPALSIITSIGLEHTRILGDTVEKIAVEKGGIIKPGCRVLVGPHVPHDVLRKCADEKGAAAYLTCDDVLGNGDGEITDYDLENSRIAKAALALLQESNPDIIKPIPAQTMELGTGIRPPCRFEVIESVEGLQIVLDVAHNPPALKYLIHKLTRTFPGKEFRFVIGMSSDKDLRQSAEHLLSVTQAGAVHLVQAAHPRAASLEAMIEAEPRLRDGVWDEKDRSITKQIEAAQVIAREKDEVVVVCGSVFLMAEARHALGFDEPRDSEVISEVAGAHLRHGQEVYGNTTLKDE